MKDTDDLKYPGFDAERDDVRRGDYKFPCASDAARPTAVQIWVGGEIADPVDDLLDDPGSRLRLSWAM
jgi:hypothetical protein